MSNLERQGEVSGERVYGASVQGPSPTKEQIEEVLDKKIDFKMDLNKYGILKDFELHGDTYNIFRWIEEQPGKMSELRELVQRERPDILIFLDTSARPTGLLFRMFEQSLGDKIPEIEFVSPPERPTSRYGDIQEHKKDSEYFLAFKQSLKNRFEKEIYNGKKIMLVDESTTTGEQLATLKEIILENNDCSVVAASLGCDDAGLRKEAAENIDFIFGKATMPPWSSKGFGMHAHLPEDVKGVRKANLTEAVDGKTTVAVPSENVAILRENILPEINDFCISYFEKFGNAHPLSISSIGAFELVNNASRRELIEALVREVNLIIGLDSATKSNLKKENMYTLKDPSGRSYLDVLSGIKSGVDELWAYLQPRRRMGEMKELIDLLKSLDIWGIDKTAEILDLFLEKEFK